MKGRNEEWRKISRMKASRKGKLGLSERTGVRSRPTLFSGNEKRSLTISSGWGGRLQSSVLSHICTWKRNHNQLINFDSSKMCVPALLFNQHKNENEPIISNIIKAMHFLRLLLSCEMNKKALLTQFLIKPFLYLWVSHQVHHRPRQGSGDGVET